MDILARSDLGRASYQVIGPSKSSLSRIVSLRRHPKFHSPFGMSERDRRKEVGAKWAVLALTFQDHRDLSKDGITA